MLSKKKADTHTLNEGSMLALKRREEEKPRKPGIISWPSYFKDY